MEFAEPTMMPPSPVAGQGDGPGKPPVTTRRYERINRPGATRQGKDAAMISTLLGARVQPKETAGAMRPVG